MRRIFVEFCKQQSAHYALSLAGMGASFLVLFMPGNTGRVLGTGGMVISLGFGAGVASTTQRFKHHSDRLESHWKQRLADCERNHTKNEKDALDSQSAKHQANLEQWSKKVESLLQQLKDKDAEFSAAVDEAKSIIGKQIEADVRVHKQRVERDALAKIKARNTEHRRREQFWSLQLQGKDEEHRQQWEEIGQKYEQLLDEYEKVITSYHPELKEIQAVFQQQMESVTQERDRIYQQLARYHDAKRFTGSTKADVNGNRLITFFLEQGITCDADHCESHFEFDEIWIRPRTHVIEHLAKFSSAIHMEFELLSVPIFEIESGCIKVILKTHTKEKTSASRVVDEQPENWLESIARFSNHYRISAPTDSGKSVFLDNLIGCLQTIHGPEFRKTLLDPKFPFTDWKSHTPDYKGFDQCLVGMENLGVLIENRFKEATEDVEAGRPIRDYAAHLFAIDELELLVDEARAKDDGKVRGKTSMALIRLLRKGLKAGRGLKNREGKGISVAYITQSPLSSRVNLNRDDFDNSTNIWMEINIARALSEELPGKLSARELAYLQRQYELRRERGDNFYALVQTKKETFIATLPNEGYYSNLPAINRDNSYQELVSVAVTGDTSVETLESLLCGDCSGLAPQHLTAPQPQKQHLIAVSTSDLKCPECESSNVKRNGSKRGKKYFKCGDCSKGFSIN